MKLIVHALKGVGVRLNAQHALEHKDFLKTLGFRWDPEAKEWWRQYDLDPDFSDYHDKCDVLADHIRKIYDLGGVVLHAPHPIVGDALKILLEEPQG